MGSILYSVGAAPSSAPPPPHTCAHCLLMSLPFPGPSPALPATPPVIIATELPKVHLIVVSKVRRRHKLSPSFKVTPCNEQNLSR